MTIGEKIKARRRELHMTTEELGKLIGVQRSAVTKYEKGHIELKATQIQAIAKALNILPVDLLSDDDESPLTDDESRLLAAYRLASDEIKAAALSMLEDSAARNRKTPASSAG